MLAGMLHAIDYVFIWSDEKISTNKHNGRLYARDAGGLPEGSLSHLRRMKSAEVMVWAAVASDVSKFPLVFVRVNTQV